MQIPTTLLHRYIPPSQSGPGGAAALATVAEGVQAANADALGRLRSGRGLSGLTIRVDVRSHGPLDAQSLSSPSHKAVTHTSVVAIPGTHPLQHAHRLVMEIPPENWLDPLRFADFHVVIKPAPSTGTFSRDGPSHLPHSCSRVCAADDATTTHLWLEQASEAVTETILGSRHVAGTRLLVRTG
jgi:hypothetical protein